MTAFANKSGGSVYIGITDDRKIRGIQIGNETVKNWINQVKLSTSPSLIPDHKVYPIQGKTILELHIDEFPIKPVSCKGRFFKRFDNSNHSMDITEITDEHLKTINSSWDYYPTTIHHVNDISMDKVIEFIKKIEHKFERSLYDNPLQVLQKYELLRDGKLTFGAYLLFAKDFVPISGVQTGRFKSPTKIIDSVSINCDLFQEVELIFSSVKKHLMVEYIITGKPHREERYDYPITALREIILNMVIHRDYRSSSDSIIKIYDDRIEFYNPGTLYGNLTIDKLLSGDYCSKTRNKLIALMFKEVGLIEKYGSGIQRIREAFDEYGLRQPLFEEFQDGFRVTCYKKHIRGGVSGGVKEIINIISQNPGIRSHEIRERLNMSQRTIERWLKKLKGEEKIEFRGSPKKGGYYPL